MSVKSVLDKIGADAKDVFAYLGGTKGQAVVATGEAVIEAVLPGTAGFLNLANTWLTEIVKTQALATAASATTGSDVQKATLAISAATPQAIAFAAANGLPAPTAATLLAANNALVAFGNAFSAGA
jgi:hypothetical protein